MEAPQSGASRGDRWTALVQRIFGIVMPVGGLFAAYVYTGLKGLLFLVGYALTFGALFLAALRFSQPTSARRYRLLLLAIAAPTVTFVFLTPGIMRFAILVSGLIAFVIFARGHNKYHA
jgi:hypothetical protein